MNRRRSGASGKISKMTGVSILTAIIVIIQIICTFIKFGPFSITLALAPIVVGAALYGSLSGAFLGFVMGIVVFVTGFFGLDGGTVMFLFGQNAIATILICLVKSTVAGFLAGVCYNAISKKNDLAGVVVSSIVCPIANTGLIILGMFAFFKDTLYAWADGTNMILYLIVGLTGLNFLVELVSNLVLASAVKRIIKHAKSSRMS